MRKIYKSKIELAFFIPLVLVVSAAGIFFLVQDLWPLSLFSVLVIGFLLHLYLTTGYEVTTDRKLKVKSGFLFNKEIYIRSIHRIRSSKSHSASPALSHDRLEIFFNRYGSVLVSPQKKSQFIAELKSINPSISIEG